jgi:hypothetical protein
LAALVLIVVAIQFIRPVRNKSELASATEISKVLVVPDSVRTILQNACYDCHSNNTRYPWYSYVQPVAWLLANDITHGKNQLNFSEFGSYSQRRQLSKLEGIADNISDNSMPLKSYKIMHKDARLPENERALLIKWAQLSGEKLSPEK